ncbi:MAG: hypothetical protein J5J00_15925 [Deltaproteobacteria bacterium]|nr:hypothetical protein [Deltaproteobacteria bacterium]
MSSKKEKLDTGKVGGVAFFLSLLAIIMLAGLSLSVLPKVLMSRAKTDSFLWSAAGLALGVLISRAIRGKPAVLIHELKHSILSNFIGNKWKEIKVRSRSGHFEYGYYKSTAKYNAFISLAPYWLPLFSLVAVPVAYAALYPHHHFMLILASAAYGCDLALSYRDISPHQSDLSDIRGGYPVAMVYIAAINLLLIAIFIAWVPEGFGSLKEFGIQFWNLVKSLATSFYSLR